MAKKMHYVLLFIVVGRWAMAFPIKYALKCPFTKSEFISN